MVKKFSKIMGMNTGQRVVRINAYVVDVIIITNSLANRKSFTGDPTFLKVHQIFENEVSCIIEAIF